MTLILSTAPSRLRRMRVRFIALLTASALALAGVTALPAPAAARGKDITKIILGAIVIAAIADALDKGHAAPAPQPQPHPQPQPPRVVPQVCAFQLQGGQAGRVAYSGECLRSYGLTRLPQHCGVPAQIYGRPDTLYPARCLRRAGFQLPT